MSYSITCIFHPCYFAVKFHYLHFPYPRCCQWKIPLLSNSTLLSKLYTLPACKFQYLQIHTTPKIRSPRYYQQNS